jgi:hypothetical protein
MIRIRPKLSDPSDPVLNPQHIPEIYALILARQFTELYEEHLGDEIYECIEYTVLY